MRYLNLIFLLFSLQLSYEGKYSYSSNYTIFMNVILNMILAIPSRNTSVYNLFNDLTTDYQPFTRPVTNINRTTWVL